MAERSVRVVNRNGVHARPAAEIVKCSARFQSEITLSREELEVNGKSIMGVMMLAAEQGATLILRARGPDEDAAVEALVQLIDGGFGER
jgi:phosphocarrier protein